DANLELFLVRLHQGQAPSPQSSLGMRPCAFFDEQMAAFSVWLRFYQPPEPSGRGEPQLEAPAELPVMLQGLLHPSCRLQALHLLASFVDLGVWAAQLALLVGSRPYLTRLLSHDEGDGKLEVAGLALVVWTKILVADGGKEGLSGKDAFHSFFKLAVLHAEPLSRLGMEVRRDSSSSRLVVGGVDRDPMQRTPVSQWNTAEQRQASRGEGEHHQNLAIRPGDRLKSVNSSINTATLMLGELQRATAGDSPRCVSLEFSWD
ncbi:unnamed protein product, partial [Polarella glacialis]